MEDPLLAFLRTGCLCSLRVGMTEEEIRAIFGSPEATGGTSRKHKTPRICRYGDIHIFLSEVLPLVCTSFYIERPDEETPIQFIPGCALEKLNAMFSMSQQDVQNYLRQNQVKFQNQNRGSVISTMLVLLESHVVITFDDQGELWSISAHNVDMAAPNLQWENGGKMIKSRMNKL
jgi:hypothetical protein